MGICIKVGVRKGGLEERDDVFFWRFKLGYRHTGGGEIPHLHPCTLNSYRYPSLAQPFTSSHQPCQPIKEGGKGEGERKPGRD